jgi:hypothetical protein
MKRLVNSFVSKKDFKGDMLSFIYLVPLISSSPLNPSLQGSILNHSFPLQQAHSDIHIISSSHNEIAG